MPIVDLRAHTEDFTADPYPYYAKLRESGPVHLIRTAEYDAVWLIVGHEEARAALTDPRLRNSARAVGYTLVDEEIMGTHLLSSDPPTHTRLRKLVAREFTARRVAGLRERVQRTTDELIDAMLPAGRADLVAALAFPLPITVICELLGVPVADRERLRAWSTAVVAPRPDNPMEAPLTAMAAYLDDLIEDKRCSGPTDDLLGDLIGARAEDGDRMSAEELRAMAYLLLIAGHETTVNLISNGVRALLDHPAQLAALRADPDGLIDGAVEEMLRYDGPVEASMIRFSAEPVPVGATGTVIPPGAIVLIGLAAGDRDPSRFPDPDRFDIRRGGQGHLAFGHGIHHCLGAPLARMEGRIAIRALLERCPGLAWDGDGVGSGLEWLPGLLMRGVRELPVRW